MSPTLLHLIYVHGFQGNDTTFQSFPTHVHQYLSERISSPSIQVKTSIYPTYKSRKPISQATRNFLEWLKTQPPGPVILVGHSMGGLLVAEAATDPSTSSNNPRRILGMIAFDCPYLGMHPHVVVAGIASLIPKGGDDDKTEKDMNTYPGVTVVDEKVTDNWDEYKKTMDLRNSSSISIDSGRTTSVLSVPIGPSPTPSPLPSPSFLGRALGFVSSHSDDPLVKWVRKHRDKPFTDGKQWITEYFQFGSCMFDPSGLTTRYQRLVGWNGTWVNYWTITVPRPSSSPGSAANSIAPSGLVPDNDVALIETGVASQLSFDSDLTSLSSPVSSASGRGTQLEKAHEKELKKIQKEREKEAKRQAKVKKGRHFVVLPTGLGTFLGGGENWEQVVIEGVDDEVAAHTGMFIVGQNLDYEGLVARVGAKVLRWCEQI